MADPADYAYTPPASDGGPTSAPDPNAGAKKNPVAYHVVNRRTGIVVAKATTRQGARRSMDFHDNRYGGYAHKVVEVGSGREKL